MLGNVGVFVDASVDPETLLHSRAALARALARGPLVKAAMRGGGDGLPLLRGITAQTIAGVAGEEQVLVFAERVRCLRQLAATLRERHGVEAHVGDGSLPRSRFEAMKAAFCAGEFPVLCLSQIGHEGHNFQNASTIVHLDLPWLQTGLEQRVGRAARPGAVRGAVQTVIPYIKRGGIEHVVSVARPPRRRAPPDPRLLRGRTRRRLDARRTARRDHRRGRRIQGRRRLRRHGGAAASRRERVRGVRRAAVGALVGTSRRDHAKVHSASAPVALSRTQCRNHIVPHRRRVVWGVAGADPRHPERREAIVLDDDSITIRRGSRTTSRGSARTSPPTKEPSNMFDTSEQQLLDEMIQRRSLEIPKPPWMQSHRWSAVRIAARRTIEPTAPSAVTPQGRTPGRCQLPRAPHVHAGQGPQRSSLQPRHGHGPLR